jgi:hypothetical protein
MSFIRATSLRQFQAIRTPALRTQRAAFSALPRVQATSDYGSGKGDPKGENPQDQGANPSADLEHPGPPPPKEGEGSGAGPTKGGKETSNSGNASKQSKGTQNTDKPQPKISNPSPPSEGESAEDQRAETASNKVSSEEQEKDKVGKDFWKGKFSPFHLLIRSIEICHSDNMLTLGRNWRCRQPALRSMDRRNAEHGRMCIITCYDRTSRTNYS